MTHSCNMCYVYFLIDQLVKQLKTAMIFPVKKNKQVFNHTRLDIVITSSNNLYNVSLPISLGQCGGEISLSAAKT